MSLPISIRLDDPSRQTLEEEARALRREQVRAQSGAVAERVAADPAAAALYEEFGSSEPAV